MSQKIDSKIKPLISFFKAQQGDIDYLLWLRNETMNEHIIRLGQVIDEKTHLDRIHYYFDDARIVYLNDHRIGLLKTTEHRDCIEIIQIQIEPQYQGRGIGQKLIKSIIKEASSKKLFVKLSVLKENKAKRLYDRIGFRVVEEYEKSYIMKFDYDLV